jgi:hypothetical protein
MLGLIRQIVKARDGVRARSQRVRGSGSVGGEPDPRPAAARSTRRGGAIETAGPTNRGPPRLEPPPSLDRCPVVGSAPGANPGPPSRVDIVVRDPLLVGHPVGVVVRPVTVDRALRNQLGPTRREAHRSAAEERQPVSAGVVRTDQGTIADRAPHPRPRDHELAAVRRRRRQPSNHPPPSARAHHLNCAACRPSATVVEVWCHTWAGGSPASPTRPTGEGGQVRGAASTPARTVSSTSGGGRQRRPAGTSLPHRSWWTRSLAAMREPAAPPPAAASRVATSATKATHAASFASSVT